MENLPNELSDRICSFMGRKELCKTMHICSSLRRIASVHLLFRLGISRSQIRTGTVKLVLSDSLYLIVFVSHICPIKRLECFQNIRRMPISEFQRLGPILGATAPIPDIVIYDKMESGWTEMLTSRELHPVTLHLLAHLPQTATDTLLIAQGDWARVSRPRTGPSPIWITPRVPPSFLFSEIVVIPLLIIPTCLFGNSWRFLQWLFRRVVGDRWSVEERISKDVHPKNLCFGAGIRIRSLSKKYTLVTRLYMENSFVIEPLRGVPDSIYSAFLAYPDFQFRNVAVESGSNMNFPDLVAFVARQEDLRVLDCSPNSIRPSSLRSTSPSQHHIPSRIECLSAPASYLPHLLPLAPHVERIDLTFSPLASRLPVISKAPPLPVFDHAAYCTALNAISRLPGSRVRTMSFIFDLEATNLPWQIPMDPSSPAPETQLHDVENLRLCTTGSTRALYYSCYFDSWKPHESQVYTGSMMCTALAPWLGRFPSLRRVTFDQRAFEVMSDEQRLGVVEAIMRMCPGVSGPGDVVFCNGE
ncbi:hypothetical protein FB45DRAFT_392674 [Roridomyces roridus]|uniref:F-box domain-containing protein n=1 Tax=Roridomyces roridus TaxID=1738132 RepID=A0AAD7FAD5_9AGAR|nr:hypothetical protein FB45DRAFT_392674 [Roridomyces roridus]